ncbi:hypothetical protein [Microcella alkaliphila]|uniref:hypothetical protein n=1 Tax=Microcella alkaliphila TaxID=279828 RepID=UPI0018E57E82|nr:hypothetical protein [Microcella alkaliphila]
MDSPVVVRAERQPQPPINAGDNLHGQCRREWVGRIEVIGQGVVGIRQDGVEFAGERSPELIRRGAYGVFAYVQPGSGESSYPSSHITKHRVREYANIESGGHGQLPH